MSLRQSDFHTVPLMFAIFAQFFKATHPLCPLAHRRTSTTCSSGWRRLLRPSRGSLTSSHWSLGGESWLTFEPWIRDTALYLSLCVMLCVNNTLFFSTPFWLSATPSPILSSWSPPRLEECSSEVPLLPREVLVFLGTKLWESTAQLSGATEQSGSSTPRPLLLVKFFIIVCR